MKMIQEMLVTCVIISGLIMIVGAYGTNSDFTVTTNIQPSHNLYPPELTSQSEKNNDLNQQPGLPVPPQLAGPYNSQPPQGSFPPLEQAPPKGYPIDQISLPERPEFQDSHNYKPGKEELGEFPSSGTNYPGSPTQPLLHPPL